MESVDSNITRKRKRGDDLRKRRFLKPDAVPTVFPNHVHRSGKALSVSRIKNENKHYVNLAEQMFAEDSVCNIDELCARLELEKDKPTGYIILKVLDILIIGQVNTSNAPIFDRSIVVNNEMEVRLYLKNDLVPSAEYFTYYRR